MKIFTIILLINTWMFGKTENVQIESILSKIFQRTNVRCFYYFHENTTSTNLVEKALIASKIPIINIHHQHPNKFQKSKCTGYIMYMEDINILRKHSSTEEILTMFKPWTKLIVFSNSVLNNSCFLNLAVNEKAIDVITIEIEDITGNNLFESITRNYNIAVSSLRMNKTLSFTSTNFYKQTKLPKIVTKTWTPKFSIPISVLLFHCPPFVIIENDTIDGIEIVILKETLKNFPVQYVKFEDDSEETDVDVWNVTMYKVIDGICDMTICSRWPVYTINKSLDMTKSTQQVCLTFLVKKPTLFPDELFVLLAFNCYILILLLFLIAVCSTILIFIEKLHNAVINKQNTDYTKHVMVILRIYTGAGVILSKMHDFIAAKMLILLCLIGSVFFATYYSVGITVNLTKPGVTNVVNNLKDMVTQQIPWILNTDNFQKDFESMDSKLYKGLAKLYVKGYKIRERTHNSAIYAKVIQNLYVNNVEHLPVEERKYYKLLSDCFGIYENVFFLKQDSPLTKLFDDTITKFVESGISDHLFKKIIKNLDRMGYQATFFTNYVEKNEGFVKIGMSKLTGAFIFLGIGLCLSFIVFIVEVLKYK